MQPNWHISIIIILLTLLIQSCTVPDKQLLANIDSDNILNDDDKITGISPLYSPELKEEFKYFAARINKDSNLHLDTLEKGYKDFQLRIWLGHSLAFVKHILIIKRNGEKWKGELVTVKHSIDVNKMTIETQQVHPRSGWDNLLTKLNNLQLFTLEDSGSLPGYDGLGGADGISYDFEIATPTKYRIFMYGNLEGYEDKYSQVRKVLKITKLLESEFDFKISV